VTKLNESTSGTDLIASKPKVSPTPIAWVLPSAYPVSSQIPLASAPEFKLPELDFSFAGKFSDALAGLGNSVATPIASLYKEWFEPEPLMITEVKLQKKGKIMCSCNLEDKYSGNFKSKLWEFVRLRQRFPVNGGGYRAQGSNHRFGIWKNLLLRGHEPIRGKLFI
jgi:hypothetical protein